MSNAYMGEFGLWIYRSLPPGMRVATLNDFQNERGAELYGVKFLVHSYHSNHFEYHVSKHNVIEKFRPWIEDSRVYVKEVHTSLSNS